MWMCNLALPIAALSINKILKLWGNRNLMTPTAKKMTRQGFRPQIHPTTRNLLICWGKAKIADYWMPTLREASSKFQFCSWACRHCQVDQREPAKRTRLLTALD